MYRPAPGGGSEVDGLESIVESVTVRVEYHRSIESCVKWKRSMYPRRSSRPRRPAEKNALTSPSPEEEEEEVKLRGRGRGARPRMINARKGVVNTGEGSNRDIIDAIDEAQRAKRGADDDDDEQGDGQSVKVADKGVDESDEDRDSVNSSICSGPSILHPTARSTWAESWCSACRELCKKAKAMKAPIKDKLLDNNPKSLTCDQWVLIKKWRPRRRPIARGSLLIHVKLVKERLGSTTQSEQNKRGGGSPACSRPHTFLRRNLRRCVRAPVKKQRKTNRRRKRTGDDSQGPRVAKQQRLHGDSRRQGNSRGRAPGDDVQPTSSRSRSSSSSPPPETWSDRKIDNQADAHDQTKLIPCTVNREKLEVRDPPSRPKTPAVSSGFRSLLAQLRNSSSVIIKETR